MYFEHKKGLFRKPDIIRIKYEKTSFFYGSMYVFFGVIKTAKFHVYTEKFQTKKK